MNNRTTLEYFKIIAILEGISYLLFAITMPLKYVYEITAPNYVVGMIHGLLFILYLLVGLVCWFRYKWKFSFVLLAVLASLLPFGTFYLEAKYLKKMIAA
jgi:integral membrane protein